jgi:hypothetical protein
MANSEDDFDSDRQGTPEGFERLDGPDGANYIIKHVNTYTGNVEEMYFALSEEKKRQMAECNRFQIEAMEEKLRSEEAFNARYGYQNTPRYQDMMRLRRLCLWMKYICRYLDDAERVDAFNWAKGDVYVSPAASGPKSEEEREELVFKNYYHTSKCAQDAMSEVKTLYAIPAVLEACVCLNSLAELMQPEVPDPTDWNRQNGPADYEAKLVYARTILRTPLAVATSRVELTQMQLAQEIQNTEPPRVAAVNSGTPGHLGLVVDFDRRTIRREGHDAVVDLSSKSALWETFRVFYAAENADAPVEAWKNALSGEWSSSRTHCSRLRSELAALAITIPDRGRRLVRDGL